MEQYFDNNNTTNSSQELKAKVVQLGYVLGLSLLLSAIIYFFASNWPGLEKWAKVGLSVSLVALFYGLSIFLIKFLNRQLFLSEFMLFAGCISFGVATGLLGQIYNSHADSYILFAIWIIPALLFSIISRYQPFYVLSYVLFHLMIWFFMFPSSTFIHRTEGVIVLFFVLMAALNAVLFWLAKGESIRSTVLSYLSFAMFHAIMIALTISHLFEDYYIAFNLVYAPILIVLFYSFLKRGAPRAYVVLLGIATSIYILIKFIDLLISYYDSEAFFFFVLLFVIGIVVGNVYLVKWIRGIVQKEDDYKKSMWSKVLIGFITVVASLLATSSIMGLIILIIGDFSEYLFLLFAVLVFILPMMLIKSIDSTIRYTLLSVGYLMGASVSYEIHILFVVGFLVLLGWSWRMISNSGVRTFAFLIANFIVLMSFWRYDINPELMLIVLVVIHALLYGLGKYLVHSPIKDSLKLNSLFYALIYFFSLTFMHSYYDFMYYVYNALFFILITVLTFWFNKQGDTIQFRVSLLFWFAFLFYKYYDLVWELLHKSVALFLLGILFIVVAYWYDRRNREPSRSQVSFLKTKLLMISLVIGLQFVLIGAQIAKSEYILSTGDLIKLELQPLDPRSLIQGDYVILSYSISSIEVNNNVKQGEKVQVILSPNEAGVYEYTGVYTYKGELNKEYTITDADVMINARYDGWSGLIYGIESFFVPEGTGREVERNARYAYVKVASNGDSILIKLTEE
jgi:uncharacterized membrane-anchored protein/uncharacterized membrane protein